MGIYTSNRYFGEAYNYAAEIPANEAYDAAFGCAHIMADNQANDMALFESAIYSDMAEVMSLQEGTQVVNENAFTNIIKKIVEMFKKLLAKIKGIFNAFLAKLAGAFKNGKDLVKKYEKQIIKYSNWKDLKIKGIRKPKSDNIKGEINGLFNMNLSNNYDLKVDNPTEENVYNPELGGTTYNPKKIKDTDASDLKEAILKNYIGAKVKFSDWASVEEDVKDTLYDDEDTLDGEDDIKSGSFFSKAWIKTVLSDDKWEKEVKDVTGKLDKVINKIIDDLNKTENKLAAHMSGSNAKSTTLIQSDDGNYRFKNYSDSKIDKDTSVTSKAIDDFDAKAGNIKAAKAEVIQKGIQAMQTIASNEQEVITKVTSLYMENIKFATAQARKIWTAAAAWSSTTHKESVEYYQALGEAAAEQFYMNMEAIGTRKED
jgi:hypothetical protein